MPERFVLDKDFGVVQSPIRSWQFIAPIVVGEPPGQKPKRKRKHGNETSGQRK